MDSDNDRIPGVEDPLLPALGSLLQTVFHLYTQLKNDSDEDPVAEETLGPRIVPRRLKPVDYLTASPMKILFNYGPMWDPTTGPIISRINSGVGVLALFNLVQGGGPL
mgnify:CR=1 FL=1